ncbi:hypothetical protein [Anabaena subtropica]|nr:hypothetical protein [Anabaena subtropica]
MYKLGEWNPQLLREIKGRGKVRDILLAVAVSLLGQIVLFMYFQAQLPYHADSSFAYNHKYCKSDTLSEPLQCIFDSYDNVIINWQLWCQDVFSMLSLIGVFILLVGGTFLLINDLATEERRDTLNFVRLSPQPPQSILIGKMLGVPIILYLVLLLAIPFHLWLGLKAQIPLSQIFSFYGILIIAGFFYYSGALLFSLVGTWLGGFQAWLGSGLVLGFLLFTKEALRDSSIVNYPIIIIRLFNPYYFIPHYSKVSQLSRFHWFALPIGASFAITVCFSVLLYLLGTYFIWESLQRCYRDPNSTMLSKKQSYLLTSSFTLITLGCTNWGAAFTEGYYQSSLMKENIAFLMFLDFGLFLYLIAALTPNRQTLQDWSRYRHIYSSQKLDNSKLIKDLIWGEKSPAILAIAINALIAITCLVFFILIVSSPVNDKYKALLALVFAGSLAIIYAALAQLVLLMKNEQRILWANGMLGAVIILPPIVLGLLLSNPSNQSVLWLLSVASPLVILYPGGAYIVTTTMFLALLGHGGILGLILFQITSQLKKFGESATKAILVGN